MSFLRSLHFSRTLLLSHNKTYPENSAGFLVFVANSKTHKWLYQMVSRVSLTPSLQPLEAAPTLMMHFDEGWHLHQPAYCGKVVSTKVGCGRFGGKFSRAVPALIMRGGLYDNLNSCSRPGPGNT